MQVFLMILTVALALVTVEIKNILYSILSFCGMCIVIGVIYWLLNAPYVAVFQLLIYAGAIVVLFIAAVMLTTQKESVR